MGSRHLNNKVTPIRGGAYTGEVADGLPEIDGGNGFLGGGPHKIQSLCGGAHILIRDRVGVGSNDQVAVNSGGHQYALAIGAWALEDHMLYPVSLAFVQQVILASGGVDHKGGGRRHLVDCLGRDSGGVDDIPAAEISLVGVDQPAAFHKLQPGNGSPQMELCPVADGGLRQGQTILPRGADGGCGGVEGGGYLFREVGVHGAGLLPGEQAELRHAVGLAPAEQVLEGSLILGREGQYEGAAGLVRNVQLGAQLFGQGGAPHIELGHQCAGLRVIPGMEDGGVGLGGAVGHVIFPLQDGRLQPVAGKVEGGGRTGDAAADDEYIVHKKTSR